MPGAEGLFAAGVPELAPVDGTAGGCHGGQSTGGPAAGAGAPGGWRRATRERLFWRLAGQPVQGPAATVRPPTSTRISPGAKACQASPAVSGAVAMMATRSCGVVRMAWNSALA